MRRRYSKIITLCLTALVVLLTFNEQQSHALVTAQTLAHQAVTLLQARCLQCHGEDKANGLDLRTRESALKGGLRGAAFVAGKPAQSLLIQFITAQQQPRMPLGGELNAAEIDLLKRWIEEGAVWAEIATAPDPRASLAAAGNYKGRPLTEAERNYWAFRPIVKPMVPASQLATNDPAKNPPAKNPIDAFIYAKLAARGLTPSPAADKATLLRRVTFDVTGLPPTPEEIQAFINDKSPDAYAKVVRRLLASPRYGERWAQHWLDVARFAETNGFELDAEREQAWRYRDYVIKSLNADKPYNRFLLEQVAGDELVPGNFEMQVATGFLRGGPQHVVAGNQDEPVNRQEWLTEAMLGVGNAALGLTVGCARCHDHKFDPISQADYYRMQAFFGAADNAEFKQHTEAEKQAYEESVKAHKAKLRPIEDKIAAIEKPYSEKIKAEKRAKLEPHYLTALNKDEKLRTAEEKELAKEAKDKIKAKWDEILMALNPADREVRTGLRQQMHRLNLAAPEPLPAALSVTDKLNPIQVMRLLKGGDPHRPAEVMTPRLPSVLLPPNAPAMMWINPVAVKNANGQPAGTVNYSTGRRLALGKWLASESNPLTPRVLVNRLWHYHFGRGIVATPNDFGRNGQQPTHPELLDWLAAEFIERGWSIKQMHELMLLSQTYQQSSTPDVAKAKIDPDNKLFWRMNRLRLDGEAVRDATLAAAGTLTEELYGKSIRVPIEPEVYENIFTEYENDNLWPVHPDARQHTRRSLYLLRKRNVRLPLLVAYDAPDMMSSCGARSVSVHALQALTLLNSEFMLEQSKALAQRVLREANSFDQRVNRLYALALGRTPQAAELRLTKEFLEQQETIIRARHARREPVAKLGESPKDLNEFAVAAWIDLCLATLNLNEFVYVN